MGDTTDRQDSIRRPARQLTAALVRTVTQPGKYFDGHGLFLRVTDSGGKQWVQRIVVQGKRAEIGLGSAALVSLAEARSQALGNRKIARAGGNPLQTRLDAAAVPTFEAAARKVHEMHAPTWRNAKHAAQFISTLETYAFPVIGKKRVSEISTADVLAVLSPIWVSKNETAARVRQRIGTVMKWAVAKGWRSDNPALAISSALPKVSEPKKHRSAMPYTDVANCLTVVRASGARPPTKLALEFLVLTAARSGEVRGARWDEMDLSNPLTGPVWVVPASRMKAKTEHRVPLSSRAVSVLEEAKAWSGSTELVFPGMKKDAPLSDMTLSKLVKELGYAVDVHGFRTSFKTWATEKTNLPNDVSERALAHAVKSKVEAAYNRSDLFDLRRELMQRWEAYLTEANGDGS